ncbi:DNA ligase N terminus [Popillia japonica]|uniref:DNA ligase n=1 Tax=Popillia japonica TaxID=7064 RepID=A0AAW1L3U4_POPJA
MQSSITQFFKAIPTNKNSQTSQIGAPQTCTPPSKRKKSNSSSSGSEKQKKSSQSITKNVKKPKIQKSISAAIQEKLGSSDEEELSSKHNKNLNNEVAQSGTDDEECSTKNLKKKRVILSSSEDECEINDDTNRTVHEKKDNTNKDDSPNKLANCNKKPVEDKSKPAEKNVFSLFATSSNSKDTDTSVTPYNPNKDNYHPIKHACWKYKEKVPYLALARTFEEIEKISARLKIIDILSNYFRSVMVLTPEDLLPSIYLCLNRLGPTYEGLELGIAATNLMKAIAQSTGRTLSQIKSETQTTGDLGLVAEQSRNNQRTIIKPAPLTVRGVFEKLKEIAKMSGQASQTKKVEKIQAMFIACKQAEARFLIRSLAGKLRIGLAEQSILQALALACATTPPNQEYPPKILDCSKASSFKTNYDNLALILKTSYCECPNYDLIVPVLLREGIEKLPEHCKLTPGIPLKPMLAHPTKGVQEVLSRFEGAKFTCEWKYDGERAQIHINEKGEAYIYSRNQENNTSKYPDIISRLNNCKTDQVQSCILDCEAVAWDVEKKQILPFQILSTRKRKDANEAEIKVQVCVFMFDLLYLNEHEGQWRFATCFDTSTMEEVQEFLEESVKGNCEGLMVKTIDKEATYEIARRSRKWLKLKKDYLEGVGDSLDVVVIGGYLGKGKRTGTYGGFLLACYDQENEEYQSICKIGTGFTDEDLQTHSEFFKAHIIPQPKPYYRYDNSHLPDHWFDVVQVWEIKCADLSLSPAHKAALGLVDPEKGISLRFPRFIRIRDDKNVEDATSAQQVVDMYNNQDQIKNQATNSNIAEEDFY